jgi:hypothetical protein
MQTDGENTELLALAACNTICKTMSILCYGLAVRISCIDSLLTS